MATRNPKEQEAELEALLSLTLARGIGTLTIRRLLEEHGSARAALQALPRGESGRTGAESVFSPALGERVRQVRKAARAAGMGILGWGLPPYPTRLAVLADAPPVLFARGDPSLLEAPALVALVGTRTPTPYGREAAQRLSAGLAALGVVVVSGLARGIDSHAHRAALKAGGTTAAVLAGGLDRLYPPESIPLAEEIARRGVLLSEMPPGQVPKPGLFPRRNRILSGISDLVVVVEAAEKSGALITAQWALDQGREVAAVPGSIFSPVSRGPFLLIRDGAAPVDSVEAVLELLPGGKAAGRGTPGEKDASPPAGGRPALTAAEKAFLEALARTGGDPEEAARLAGIPPEDALALGVALEMKGRARSVGQGLLFPT